MLGQENVSPVPSHSEFEGQIGMIQSYFNCGQLCCKYFHDHHATDKANGAGKTLAPSIAIFDAEPSGINCASIALNQADIIPITRYKGVIFGAQRISG